MLPVLGLTGILGTPGLLVAQSDFEFFERKIRPVLVENCYKCHSANSEKLKGALLLDSAEGMRKGGESGKPAIVPGDPQASRLILAISNKDEDLQMPPKKRLRPDQVADFVVWVQSGAPDPRTNNSSKVAPSKSTAQHWAFQPPRLPPTPAVQKKLWPLNEIDRFILHKLEEQGLSPAPPADRRTLIRRAYFVLHGLPPADEDVHAFEQDTSPDAFPKVIDHLLGSPRYGERWARHWLDLARYSDTKGYVYGDREDPRFVYSHTYRDWVIDAFNTDMPYDQFLKFQIAADQLSCDRKHLAAMGFLTLGRRFLGVVHDIIDDRIDTLTRGMQALTVSCARCHDHKFDPISTRDYYSLYGVFNASAESIVPIARIDDSSPVRAHYVRELEKRTLTLTNEFYKMRETIANRLRVKTTDYLLAQKDVHKLPTEEFYEILSGDELNPAIVRQWHTFLQSTPKDDPIFAPWHASAAGTFSREAFERMQLNPLVRSALAEKFPNSQDDLARVYGELLTRTHEKWQMFRTNSTPPSSRFEDPNEEQLRQVLYSDTTPVYPPKGSYVDAQFYFDEGGRVKLAKLEKEIDILNLTHPAAVPQAGILTDKEVITNPRVFKRGNPGNRGEEVLRQYLEIVAGKDRKPFTHGSGRLEMAEIIASRHNPLTARVIVNRVWQLHFGAGLVKSTSDFGTRADAPSHPELLDYLALRFMDEGWSLKKLHRLILTSRAFQQSSDATVEWSPNGEPRPRQNKPAMADPENRLLWRMNRHRLDFEAMHDYLLTASGELKLNTGGPGENLLKRPSPNRRAIYGHIDRQFLPGVYRVFDFANPDLHTPVRHLTTVPQQALFFMNSPFVIERAEAIGDILAGCDTDRIDSLYRRLFQRAPQSSEITKGVEFIKSLDPQDFSQPSSPPTPAWQYGRAHFEPASGTLNEFRPLAHFAGDSYQPGTFDPDPVLGPIRLKADGGHTSDKCAAVRRWLAPTDCVVRISGTLLHEKKDGNVRAALVLNEKTSIAIWALQNQKAETAIEDISVKKGDTIDFVVASSEGSATEFKWSPKISVAKDADKMRSSGASIEWDAKANFAGPPEPPLKPLTPWAAYAQALFFSNEFMFVD